MNENETFELSEAEKANYNDWLHDAYEAARDFDGSETRDNALYKPLENIDRFIQDRNNGLTSIQLEQAFAQACSPNLPKGAPRTVSTFLSLAGQFYDRASNASTKEDLLTTLSDGGTLIIPSSSIFVQTDEGALELSKTNNPLPFEKRTQPRLALLVKHLKEAGIYTDDLIIHAGIAASNMVRSEPYMLVQIPRLDREVVVCDQVGEITFVSNRILGPTAWEHLSKEELKARDDVRAIVFNSEEQWWNDIAGTLIGHKQDPEKRRKVNLSSFAKKKQPLDIELIKHAAIAHHAKTGEWPKQHSGEIFDDPLQGNTWRAVYLAIQRRSRGLGQANLPDEVKGLASLLEWQGLTVSLFSETRNLTVDDITALAKAHHQRTGKWPVQSSGEILDGPLKCDKWGNIDAAIKRRQRGLDQGGLPDEVKGLISLLEWQGLTISHLSKTKVLSVKDIVVTAKAHHQKTGKWPTEHSGEIKVGKLKGDKWVNISAAISARGRGLAQTKLPYSVKTIGSFLEWQGLKVTHLSKTKILKVTDIITAAKAHRAQAGEWPHTSSGDIKVAPLKGDRWASICAAIRQRGRSLDQAGLPDEVKGLASLLKWQNLENDAPRKLLVEDVAPTPH